MKIKAIYVNQMSVLLHSATRHVSADWNSLWDTDNFEVFSLRICKYCQKYNDGHTIQQHNCVGIVETQHTYSSNKFIQMNGYSKEYKHHISSISKPFVNVSLKSAP